MGLYSDAGGSARSRLSRARWGGGDEACRDPWSDVAGNGEQEGTRPGAQEQRGRGPASSPRSCWHPSPADPGPGLGPRAVLRRQCESARPVCSVGAVSTADRLARAPPGCPAAAGAGVSHAATGWAGPAWAPPGAVSPQQSGTLGSEPTGVPAAVCSQRVCAVRAWWLAGPSPPRCGFVRGTGRAGPGRGLGRSEEPWRQQSADAAGAQTSPLLAGESLGGGPRPATEGPEGGGVGPKPRG